MLLRNFTMSMYALRYPESSLWHTRWCYLLLVLFPVWRRNSYAFNARLPPDIKKRKEREKNAAHQMLQIWLYHDAQGEFIYFWEKGQQ